jgi:hypothetical protein
MPSRPSSRERRITASTAGSAARRSGDVLGLLEVAEQGQRIAEGHVLEAPGDLREGVQVALLGLPDQRVEIH